MNLYNLSKRKNGTESRSPFKLGMGWNVYELALLALDQEEAGWKESDGSKDDLAKHVTLTLASHAAMLADYFSLEVVFLNMNIFSFLLFYFSLGSLRKLMRA